MPGKLFYNPQQEYFAKKLRKNMTLGEVLLWQRIRKKQILGADFNRQTRISNYIVDFCCLELKLVIEVDGSSHDEKALKDELRDKALSGMGFTVLRIADAAVKKRMDSVIDYLKQNIQELRSAKISSS